MFGQLLNTHRIFKRLAMALIRLRLCAGWSESLLVAFTTLLEISCRGSYMFLSSDKNVFSKTTTELQTLLNKIQKYSTEGGGGNFALTLRQ